MSYKLDLICDRRWRMGVHRCKDTCRQRITSWSETSCCTTLWRTCSSEHPGCCHRRATQRCLVTWKLLAILQLRKPSLPPIAIQFVGIRLGKITPLFSVITPASLLAPSGKGSARWIMGEKNWAMVTTSSKEGLLVFVLWLELLIDWKYRLYFLYRLLLYLDVGLLWYWFRTLFTRRQDGINC